MNVVPRRPGRRVSRGRLVAGAIAVTAVLVLAACGGGSSSSMTNNGGVSGAAKTIGSARRVTATETDFSIVLSQTTFAPGTYTFVATNKGHVAHSLEIAGPGVSNRRIAGTIPPGSARTLTVRLQKGSYRVFCPVPGHERLGMLVDIKVGGVAHAARGGTPTTTSSGSSWG